jgi:hypothetical protein
MTKLQNGTSGSLIKHHDTLEGEVSSVFKVEYHAAYHVLGGGGAVCPTEHEDFPAPVSICIRKAALKASCRVEWSGVELNLQLMVSPPVCLGVGPPFGAHDQSFWHVLASSCREPSLTRAP